VNRFSSRDRTIGFILLLISIVVYVMLVTQLGLHERLYLFNLMRHYDKYGEFCSVIDYMGVCPLYYIYLWALSRLPSMLVILPQLILITLTYYVSYRLIGSHAISGYAALLLSIAPGFTALFTIDFTGLLYTSTLVAIAILLLIHGVLENNKVSLLTGMALYAILMFHPHVSLALIASSIVLLTTTSIERSKYLWLLTLAQSALIAVGMYISGVTYYGLLGLLGLALGLGASLAALTLRTLKSSGFKAIVITQLALLVAVVGISTLYVIKTPAKLELTVEPARLLGLSGFLVIPGFIYSFTKGVTEKIRSVIFSALILTILLAVDVGSYLHPLVLLTIVSGYTVWIIRGWIQSSIEGGVKPSVINPYMAVLVVLLVVLPALVYPVFARNALITVSVDEELVELAKTYGGSVGEALVAALKDLASNIASTASGKCALLVAYWDYSYILASELEGRGVCTRLLGHREGSSAGKLLISSTMTGSWASSIELLKKLKAELNVTDVYVLVAFAHSSTGNISIIGAPRLVQQPQLMYPLLTYEAYGDNYRVKKYLEFVNRSIGDYVQSTGLGLRVDLVALRPDGEKMLVNQLITKTLVSMNYESVYKVIGLQPVQISSEVVGLELVAYKVVWSSAVSLGAFYGTQNVNYILAVFRLVET
jgi:hypothetical protein